MNLSEVQTATDAAAQAIATLDPERWAGWVTYLLEALDGQAEEDQTRAMLEALSRDIASRLDLGRW